MSTAIYKLKYENSEGGVVDFPTHFTRDGDIAAMRAFAQECGYAPKSIEDAGGIFSLTKFFGNVALVPDHSNDRVDLSDFKVALKKETGLFPIPDEIIDQRHADGVLKCVVDGNDRLVATFNVLPKLNDGIKKHLGIEDDPGKPQVYELGAGWSRESYRGVGIYTKFRTAVLEAEHADDRLMFSQNYGKGASSVNRREGWTLVDPRKFPFATALLSWSKRSEGFMGGKIQLASGLQLGMPPGNVYGGDPVFFSKDNETGLLPEATQNFLKSHEWERAHHIWVNDYTKLEVFEGHLRVQLIPEEEYRENQHVLENTYKNWLTAIKKNSFVVEKPVSSKIPDPKWAEFSEGGVPPQLHDAPEAAAE